MKWLVECEGESEEEEIECFPPFTHEDTPKQFGRIVREIEISHQQSILPHFPMFITVIMRSSFLCVFDHPYMFQSSLHVSIIHLTCFDHPLRRSPGLMHLRQLNLRVSEYHKK